MVTRENVPAPEGHICNEAWHDDAQSHKILRLADEMRGLLEDMVSERRQRDVHRAAVATLDKAVQ